MEICKTVAEMRAFVRQLRAQGKRVALVPTMGFLHDGHLSLIDIAAKKADAVVVSIFVNPTQFGPTEDLDCYPRDFERDCKNCDAHGVAAIFAPAPEEMYAKNRSIWVTEEVLSKKLCGKTRPIHFRGVCTVVAKLFNIVQPDVAVFGQKDAQQALIIRRMVRDLDFPVEIITAPLVRGADGLALSSRNKYLSDEEHRRALVLSRSLFAAEKRIRAEGLNAVPQVLAAMHQAITAEGGEIDYVECYDSATLETPEAGAKELLLALAVRFGTTRLIDNVLIQMEP